MAAEGISERLISLRKHLGERLGTKLTTQDVGSQCGLEKHKVYRLENGLLGTTAALVSLLNFYRGHGYNLDWILMPDNSRVPMMLSSGNELLKISEKIHQLSRLLNEGYNDLNTHLRELGYERFDDNDLSGKESDVPVASELLPL
jgi:hypothetical protein